MHVVITSNTSWNILNFRLPVVEALLAHDVKVTVVAPEDEYTARLTEMGLGFVPLDMNRGGTNPLAELASFLRFVRILRALRPDVVLPFTIKNNLYALYAGRLLGIRAFPNISGLGIAFTKNTWLSLAARRLYRFGAPAAPAMFFQNQNDAAYFLRAGIIDKTKARILPGSGVDLARFTQTPLPEGPVTFLMIARLMHDKGTAEFANAARRIRNTDPDVRFDLIGALEKANDKAVSQADIAAWEKEGLITWHGHVDDVRPFIRRAHCIVLPSYYPEGTPRSLLEGAASGRPVITTDMPGCRNVVEEGRTGYLVAPRSAEALAAAMDRFLRLPAQEREAMGAAGRHKIEREYDQAIVQKAYLDALVL